MKCRKKYNAQVGFTDVLRPCQDVNASNASQLSFIARLNNHATHPLRFYYVHSTTGPGIDRHLVFASGALPSALRGIVEDGIILDHTVVFIDI